MVGIDDWVFRRNNRYGTLICGARAFGEAAAEALPNAIQTTYRWHLMENASSAFLDAVRKSTQAIRATAVAVKGQVVLPIAKSAWRLGLCGFS